MDLQSIQLNSKQEVNAWEQKKRSSAMQGTAVLYITQRSVALKEYFIVHCMHWSVEASEVDDKPSMTLLYTHTFGQLQRYNHVSRTATLVIASHLGCVLGSMWIFSSDVSEWLGHHWNGSPFPGRDAPHPTKTRHSLRKFQASGDVASSAKLTSFWRVFGGPVAAPSLDCQKVFLSAAGTSEGSCLFSSSCPPAGRGEYG